MASVPNMRPAAGIPVGDGKAPADGEAAAASPFATLLAIGTPKAADATPAPTPATPADLIAALQQAITGRTAPVQGKTEAAKDGDDTKATPTDGSDDDGDDDTATAAAGPDATSADLVPLIEAQTAAPVTVTPVPAPTPKTDAVAETTGAPAKADGQPARARSRPDQTAPSLPQVPVTPLLLPGALPPSQPAAATGEAPVQAALVADMPAGKPADKKASVKAPAASSDAADIESKPETAAAPTPRTAPQVAPDRPAPQQTGATATAPADKPAAPAAPASPPAPLPANPMAAVQAALATIADPGPDPAATPGGKTGAADTPIADRVMTHQLDLARDSAWLDRLARDIATSADGDAPMRFKLHPEMLGQMRVELSQGDRGTSVRLTVESETTRGIVADAQPRLVAEARAQGVRIAETHVDLAGGSGGQASSDPRRHEAAREPVFLRTAHHAAGRSGADDQPRRGGRAERYA